MSTTGSIEWSESGSAAEIQGMIEDWKGEGKRGAALLIAAQEMISKEFLTTLSPRSCIILRRFLTVDSICLGDRRGCDECEELLESKQRLSS
jgi:hypothetical protein